MFLWVTGTIFGKNWKSLFIFTAEAVKRNFVFLSSNSTETQLNVNWDGKCSFTENENNFFRLLGEKNWEKLVSFVRSRFTITRWEKVAAICTLLLFMAKKLLRKFCFHSFENTFIKFPLESHKKQFLNLIIVWMVPSCRRRCLKAETPSCYSLSSF